MSSDVVISESQLGVADAVADVVVDAALVVDDAASDVVELLVLVIECDV